MGKNLVTKKFQVPSTWTAPAGVNSINLYLKRLAKPVLGVGYGSNAQGCSSVYDPSYNRMFNFGGNIEGNLGDGTTTNRSTPTAIGLVAKNISSSSPSMIDRAGNIIIWGSGNTGENGNNSTTNYSNPTFLVASLTGSSRFRKIIKDLDTSIVLTANGSVRMCGSNSQGQLGLGDTTPRSTFATVNAAILSPAIQITTGTTITISFLASTSTYAASGCIKVTDLNKQNQGKIYMWGRNLSGQLGDGTSTDRSTPTPLLSAFEDFVQLVTNGACSYGLRSNGDLYAWGNNGFSQLGNGSGTSVSTPVLIGGGLKFKKVATSATNDLVTGSYAPRTSAAAITTDGKLYTWGYNGSGQLGLGDTTNRSTPTFVTSFGSTKIVDVAMSKHSLALAENGTVWSCGYNAEGQLGLNDTTSRSTYTQITFPNSFPLVTSNEEALIYTDRLSVIPGRTYTVNFSNGSANFIDNTSGELLQINATNAVDIIEIEYLA